MGHLGRCISIVNPLSNKVDGLQVHAFEETHPYLHKNLRENCLLRTYRTGVAKDAQKARLIIHDWRPEVAYFRMKKKVKARTKLISLYHSDFFPSKQDDKEMKKFKRHIRSVANQTDLFIHMNLLPPRRHPGRIRCIYIPVPLITREVSKTPAQVKQLLGLREDEPFILVQMGSGLGKHRYKDIKGWYKQVDRLANRYRFVVAGMLAEEGFPFREEVIRAPLFPNGKDLVHAADLVIAKPGMGILGDCISTQTPLLFLPGDNPERKQKVEMLRRILKNNLGIVKKPEDLSEKMDRALKQKDWFRKQFKSIPVDGAEVVANILARVRKIPRHQLRRHRKQISRISPFAIPMRKGVHK